MTDMWQLTIFVLKGVSTEEDIYRLATPLAYGTLHLPLVAFLSKQSHLLLNKACILYRALLVENGTRNYFGRLAQLSKLSAFFTYGMVTLEPCLLRSFWKESTILWQQARSRSFLTFGLAPEQFTPSPCLYSWYMQFVSPLRVLRRTYWWFSMSLRYLRHYGFVFCFRSGATLSSSHSDVRLVKVVLCATSQFRVHHSHS